MDISRTVSRMWLQQAKASALLFMVTGPLFSITGGGCRVVRIDTPDEFRYVYVADYGIDVRDVTNITFSVRAHNDAHVTLSRYKDSWMSEAYEIVIGGWVNKKSAIRKCDQCSNKAFVDHHPLSEDQHRAFWVSWDGGVIRVGHGSEVPEREFMAWVDKDPYFVRYLGVSTGWGSTGVWAFNYVSGGWSTWSAWSACAATCGGSQQLRQRTCTNPTPVLGEYCNGTAEESLPCADNPCPVSGAWSSWGPWTECSLTCGSGVQTRTRGCNAPAPAHGGEECAGDPVDETDCLLEECPLAGAWSSWTAWSACSRSCGFGEQQRARLCDSPAPAHGGETCGGAGNETSSCFIVECPVAGGWSAWTTWSPCSASCGPGARGRQRACDSPAPMYGGRPCAGEDSQTEACTERPCPVDGSWSSWSAWSSCSGTCGHGVRERARTCTAPAPRHGGADCTGSPDDTAPCFITACPVDGSWSAWSPWSACSATCGPGGVETRTRGCTAPPPSHGGRQCQDEEVEGEEAGGGDTQTRECYVTTCAVDGGWSSWSAWTACSLTCGIGQETRGRACDRPAPAHGGEACHGGATDARQCLLLKCPVDGGWSAWSPWSACSKTCAYGAHARSRSCSAPAPQYGGRPCPGDVFQQRPCYDRECPVDGGWTSWSAWDPCSALCGGGWRVRSRWCAQPEPMHGGAPCNGSQSQNKTCNLQDCPDEEIRAFKQTLVTVEAQGAQAIAGVTLGVLVTLGGIIVLLDATAIRKHVRYMKKNVNSFVAYQKAKKRQRRRRPRSLPPAPPLGGGPQANPAYTAAGAGERYVTAPENVGLEWKDNRRAAYLAAARPHLLPRRKALNIENDLLKPPGAPPTASARFNHRPAAALPGGAELGTAAAGSGARLPRSNVDPSAATYL